MSTERELASLLRSWFRSEPDGSVDHVIDAILGEVDATNQRRSTWWPARRSFPVNTMIKFGIAATVLAMTLAIGYGLWQNIGNQQPVPAPSQDDAAGGALPVAVQRFYVGEPRILDGVSDKEFVALDLTSGVLRVHQAFGITALLSAASLAASDAIRFETVLGGTECDPGDVGTYPYRLSPGERRLVIEAGTDDCAIRLDGVVGEWIFMDCASADNWCLGALEPGSYASLFFDPWGTRGEVVTRHGALTYEIPEGWVNADDRTDFYSLLTGEGAADYTDPCIECPDGLWLGRAPNAAAGGCAGEPDASVGTSAAELAAWLRSHPSFDVVDRPPVTVGGRAAIVLDVSVADGATTCEVEGERIVELVASQEGYSWGLSPSDRQRVMFIDLDESVTLTLSIDPLEAADLEALAAEVAPIIASMRFTEP